MLPTKIYLSYESLCILYGHYIYMTVYFYFRDLECIFTCSLCSSWAFSLLPYMKIQ